MGGLDDNLPAVSPVSTGYTYMYSQETNVVSCVPKFVKYGSLLCTQVHKVNKNIFQKCIGM